MIEVLTFNGLIIYNNIIGKFFALALSIKIFQNIFQIDFSTQFLGSDVQFNKKLTYTTQLQQTRQPQHTQQTTLHIEYVVLSLLFLKVLFLNFLRNSYFFLYSF